MSDMLPCADCHLQPECCKSPNATSGAAWGWACLLFIVCLFALLLLGTPA